MPVVLTILLTAAIGLPAAFALTRRRIAATAGAAFLAGTGIVYGAMLLLSLVHVPWSFAAVTGTAAALAVACWFAAKSRVVPQSRSSAVRPHIMDLATLAAIVLYAMRATITNVWEWDFWAIWGLKGRIFFEARGIDWRFLESRWNAFAHPDYPLLVPVNYAYAALAGGAWSDRWLGIYNVAFAAAALLVVRELLTDELTPLVASVATFASTAFIFSGAIGLAEGAVIAFGTCSILFLRRGEYPAAAVLLGLAAAAKNEGLTLIIAAGAAVLLTDRRHAGRLWPAVAIAAPWLLMRRVHALSTDLLAPGIFARASEHLRHTGDIAVLLFRWLPDAGIWLLMLLAIVFVRPRKGDGRALITIGLQALALIAAYFVTPNDVAWHIATSWERLAQQLAAPLVVVVMLMLARAFARADDPLHAEARSQL